MKAFLFEGVSKEFLNAARPAVNHITCEVEDGSFVVLPGPSGCGKTTYC